MFHNLTKWADLINQTGRPMLIENCHQGAYTPGIGQWQGYAKNKTSGGYFHFLGMFFGMGVYTSGAVTRVGVGVLIASAHLHVRRARMGVGRIVRAGEQAKPNRPPPLDH